MGQNKLFPIFLKIKNQPCLVVGGGKVAYQKIKQLIESEGDVTVISKECINEISKLNKIKWIKSKYKNQYLSGYKLVISATSNNRINKAVYVDATKMGIPVNIVDQPELCSFYFGSVHTDGDLKVAVSTNGKSPSAGKQIRNLIIKSLPSRIDNIIDRFSKLREQLKYRMLFTDRKIFLNNLSQNYIIPKTGKVVIVGCGPGSPELLSIKAAETISTADVLLYDALIHADILTLASEKAKKIFVGKRCEKNCINQSTINKMMLNYAQSGKIVVRLKGGDPFLFGRGGEEAIFLRENNVSFNIIPGITAGIGAASQAGIPLTHRDYSKGVLFLTGHEFDNNEKINWNLVSQLNMTLVIYMGYKKLNKILLSLIEGGKDVETPIGIIQKGTTEEQKIVIGKIGSINKKIKREKLETPIIIIIGEVVNIYKYLKNYIEINPAIHSNTNNFGIHQFQDISN